MSTTLTQQNQPLVLADPSIISNELQLVDPGSVATPDAPDPQLDKQSDDFVKLVLACNPDDPANADARDKNVAAVEALGSKTQQESGRRSAMLKEPIRKLAARGEDGGQVASALVDLKFQVEELDPGNFDFEAGWFSRALGMLPGIGTPLKKFFTKFESSQTVIDAIVRSLEDGKKVLQRDNVTLSQDQKAMRALIFRITKVIELGMLLDQKFSYTLEREIMPEDPRRRFIEDEVLFPLRQRIQDLQQQLAVNQQGV
ncbi:MAG: toxic anion resistance protein, partial [Desulfobacterales bacterium]|nr:toxic anion resistance protein [Desulfobacterales bacterium]